MSKQRGTRKTRVGVVVSDKMDKTVVVRMDQVVRHPTYDKYIRRKVTFKAHDEQNACKIGDKVEVVETRPLSKDKCWRVRQIIEKSVTV